MFGGTFLKFPSPSGGCSRKKGLIRSDHRGFGPRPRGARHSPRVYFDDSSLERLTGLTIRINEYNPVNKLYGN